MKRSSHDIVIGIDLGGSGIRAGSVAMDGRLLNVKKVDIPAIKGKDLIILSMTDMIRSIILQEREKRNNVIAIGIGSPGIINMEKGIVITSPNFPGWNNIPLKALLEKSVNLPVTLDNDANSAAYGEKWRGAGRKVSSLVCITMGTGIGGGIILNNNVWHGGTGMAGEIGHIIVNPSGPRCSCGRNGCLESYSSATAMVRSALESIAHRKRTLLRRISGGDQEKITAKMIHEAALKGDRIAAGILHEAGMYLGIAIASLINFLNPEMFVLTGAVTGSWDFFMPAARDEIARRSFPAMYKKTRIVRGRLSGNAGLIGAAGLAWKKMRNPSGMA